MPATKHTPDPHSHPGQRWKGGAAPSAQTTGLRLPSRSTRRRRGPRPCRPCGSPLGAVLAAGPHACAVAASSRSPDCALRRLRLRVSAGGLAALGECWRGLAERGEGSDWASLVLPGSRGPGPLGPLAQACQGAGRASRAAHLRSEVTPRRALRGWQVPKLAGPGW